MTPARTAARPDAFDAHPDTPFFSHQEHFALVASTNDAVAGWLAQGTPEVCLATADEQVRGRGREGRTWTAPAGSSLLLSLGFRPAWLSPERTWRLAAVVSLAMADAAEEVAGLADGAIRLKWPNDLVVEFERTPAPDADATEMGGEAGTEAGGEAGTEARGEAGTPAGLDAGRIARPESAIRKLAGVLGETSGLGTGDPRVVIGIGINADWRREDFPPDLAAGMTSLRDASGGRPVDRVHLLDAFLGRLEARVEGLRRGHFALSDWQERQVTTGRLVDLVYPDARRVTVAALDVDARTGGLVVDDAGTERVIHSAEILHVRMARAAIPAANPGIGV